MQRTIDWSEVTLFLISAALVLLCLFLVKPFLPGITWAVVLAIVTQRPYRWILSRLKSPSLSSLTMTLLVALALVVPTITVLLNAGGHVLQLVRSIQSSASGDGLRKFIASHPSLADLLQTALDNFNVSQAFERSVSAVTMHMASFLGRSIAAFTQSIVALFILFFLYRDTSLAVGFARRFMPLHKDEADYLLRRVQAAISALVLGRFAVAALQGLVAGIAYWALGVGAPTLLGVATMLFALVPGIGAFVIWLPVVIYLALIHHWVQAIILLAAGSLVISTLDNVLYPILVGTQLRLHSAPIFLAMLGGVLFFGVSGLILGPVTFTAAESAVLIWRKRTMDEALPEIR